MAGNVSDHEIKYMAQVLALLPPAFTELLHTQPAIVLTMMHEGYVHEIPPVDLALRAVQIYGGLMEEERRARQ